LVSFIVQQVEGNLLQPFIMSRAVELHPALVLTALTIGGLVGGLSGVFLAIPVAATIKTILLHSGETDAEGLAGVSEQAGPTPAPG
jgi:predicted PurR-regulated permease PerM